MESVSHFESIEVNHRFHAVMDNTYGCIGNHQIRLLGQRIGGVVEGMVR